MNKCFNNKVTRHLYLIKKELHDLVYKLLKNILKTLLSEPNCNIFVCDILYISCIFESTSLLRKYHVRENENYNFINSIFIFVSGGMFPFQYFSAYDVLLDLETRNTTYLQETQLY